MLEHQTLDHISTLSGYSKRTLQNLFYEYLNAVPIHKVENREKVHVIIDGTYFSQDICLVAYRDNDIKKTILYRITDDELTSEIIEDFQNLRAVGFQIESITCDGHRAILKAIKKVFKRDVLVQRCVVHVERQCRTWLTRNPQSEAGRELLRVVRQISRIRTLEHKYFWLRSLYDWDVRHKDFISQRSTADGRYTHTFLRKARRMLINAFSDMFHYIDNPEIPKSTNAIESFFGHLKDNLSIHRGLTVRHRKAFIQWYIHYKNEK